MTDSFSSAGTEKRIKKKIATDSMETMKRISKQGRWQGIIGRLGKPSQKHTKKERKRKGEKRENCLKKKKTKKDDESVDFYCRLIDARRFLGCLYIFLFVAFIIFRFVYIKEKWRNGG